MRRCEGTSRLTCNPHRGGEPVDVPLGITAENIAEKWGTSREDQDELAVIRDLGLPLDRTNPNGSGVALGHPIGATGAILAVKALHELARSGGRYAVVSMCIGGGQGIAAVFERERDTVAGRR